MASGTHWRNAVAELAGCELNNTAMGWRSLRTDDVARTEQLVVQLEEAKALIERDTVACARLALILLDNATEILMFRNIETLLVHNHTLERIVKQWNEILEESDDSQARAARDEVEGKVVPKKKRKDLEYKFDAKVEFLEQRDSVEKTVARIIKRLHRYRNESYHRDTVRDATIQSACRLYFYIACMLFETLDQFVAGEVVRESPPTLAKYMPSEASWGLPANEMITEQLRRGLGIDNEELKHLLIDHLTGRLDGLEANLSYVRETLFGWLPEELSSGPWLELVIQIAQVHEKYEELPTYQELLALKLPYSVVDLPKWRKSVTELEALQETLELFAAFADIEESFEPFEVQADDLAERLDLEQQLEEEIRRGK